MHPPHSNAERPSISTSEQRFLEEALASLPTGPMAGTTAAAEELTRYNHHANPYLRAYARVLWCGFAMARGQVADGHGKFKIAHRDASLAAIDKVTEAAMLSANEALERSTAHDGSVSLFLAELRERTLQRLWSRVCETSGLPPPSFGRILARAQGGRASTRDSDADASSDADDIAEFMLKKPSAAPDPVSAGKGEDDGLMEGDYDDDDDDDDYYSYH